jgi:hypothetical protein
MLIGLSHPLGGYDIPPDDSSLGRFLADVPVTKA